MNKLYSNFKNTVRGSWLLHALAGGLILGAIPALSAVILTILSFDTEGINAAIAISALGGASGGIAVYFTRTMMKKGGWSNYLAWSVIVEAYVITVILGIFVAVTLYPYLRDESFEDDFHSPTFHLILHIYVILLATISVGVISLQKSIRRRKKASLNNAKPPSRKDEQDDQKQ
jgi:hypothetical protein